MVNEYVGGMTKYQPDSREKNERRQPEPKTANVGADDDRKEEGRELCTR